MRQAGWHQRELAARCADNVPLRESKVPDSITKRQVGLLFVTYCNRLDRLFWA
jgi:hypothetical protein